MNQKINASLCILMIAALGLAGCGPVQAKEGKIYIAGEGATITTYSRDSLSFLHSTGCSVPKGTIAFPERETFVRTYFGSGQWNDHPTTEVAHTGKGCSYDGSYDFIKGKPEKAGWTLVEPQGLEAAKDVLCTEPGPRDFSAELEEACSHSWGRTK